MSQPNAATLTDFNLVTLMIGLGKIEVIVITAFSLSAQTNEKSQHLTLALLFFCEDN